MLIIVNYFILTANLSESAVYGSEGAIQVMTSNRVSVSEPAEGHVGPASGSIELAGSLRFLKASLIAILCILLVLYAWFFLGVKLPFLFFLVTVPLGYIVDRMTLRSPSPFFFHQLAVKEIQGALASKGGVRVVDACCGEGYSAIFFAKYFPNAKIIAVDKYEKALEKARKLIVQRGLSSRIDLVKADLEDDLRQLNFDGRELRNSADAVICQSAFYLLKFPEVAIRNLSDFLVDGGVLFVSDVKKSLQNTPLVSMLVVGYLYFILQWLSVVVNSPLVDTIALILLVLFGLHLGMTIPFLLCEYQFYTSKDIARLLKLMGFRRFSVNEFFNIWYFSAEKLMPSAQ